MLLRTSHGASCARFPLLATFVPGPRVPRPEPRFLAAGRKEVACLL